MLACCCAACATAATAAACCAACVGCGDSATTVGLLAGGSCGKGGGARSSSSGSTCHTREGIGLRGRSATEGVERHTAPVLQALFDTPGRKSPSAKAYQFTPRSILWLGRTSM
eukprot:2159265-Prymnesium_polylepis.2